MRAAGVATLLALNTVHGVAAAQQPAEWRLTQDMRIGSEIQGREYLFTDITGVVPLRDGSVYVADSRSNDIRLFNTRGGHVRTVGGEGDGPGEFRRLSTIGIIGDTLWALDLRNRRTTLFGSDGTVLRTITNSTPLVPTGAWNVRLTALLPSGLALGTASPGLSSTSSSELEPVLLLTRAGNMIDTLAWVSARNRYFRIASGGGGLIGAQPFGDAGLVIPDPARSRVFVVDRSAAVDRRRAAVTVTTVGVRGDTLWTVSVPYVPVPVPRDSAERFLAGLLRGHERTGISTEAIRREAFTPDYFTPVSAGVASTDGLLWLRRDDRPPAPQYWVVGRTGVIATVKVPARVRILAVAGQVVWAVEKDEFDVPRLIRYRLRRE